MEFPLLIIRTFFTESVADKDIINWPENINVRDTVPVKGIAALHVRKARVLHACYTQCPCSVHAPYTQIHEDACNYTHVV